MPSERLPLFARRCRWLAIFATVTAAFPVLVILIQWMVPAWRAGVARAMAGFDAAQPITLTWPVELACVVLSLLYLAVLAWGLLAVRRLCLRLAEGRIFEPQTGLLLRRFGLALLIFACADPFVSSLIGLLITRYNAPGQHHFEFAIDDSEVLQAFVGMLILLIGSVMAEAARIAEENRQII